MNVLIPIISSIFFRLGGVGKDDRFLPFMKPPTLWANKWWRWLMGVPIAIITHSWLCVITYFVATNIFVYGENGWLRKLLGKDLSWIIYGSAFGFSSCFALPFGLVLTSTLLGGVSFWYLMKLSNEGIFLGLTDTTHKTELNWYLDQSYVEIGVGFFGTICYLWR